MQILYQIYENAEFIFKLTRQGKSVSVFLHVTQMPVSGVKHGNWLFFWFSCKIVELCLDNNLKAQSLFFTVRMSQWWNINFRHKSKITNKITKTLSHKSNKIKSMRQNIFHICYQKSIPFERISKYWGRVHFRNPLRKWRCSKNAINMENLRKLVIDILYIIQKTSLKYWIVND